jgi:proteasome lid subunit RPN8/RPN11
LAADPCGTLQLVFVKNRATKPGQFRIDPADEQRVRKELGGARIVGTFHSHPVSPATPSGSDIVRARIGHYLLIHDVCGCVTSLWRVQRVNGNKTTHEVELRSTSRKLRASNRNLAETPRRSPRCAVGVAVGLVDRRGSGHMGGRK